MLKCLSINSAYDKIISKDCSLMTFQIIDNFFSDFHSNLFKSLIISVKTKKNHFLRYKWNIDKKCLGQTFFIFCFLYIFWPYSMLAFGIRMK